MRSKATSPNLVLMAMVFAVSMNFIDQTIIALAVPEIQDELKLSTQGVQWVINAYVLALAASFILAGKLSDVFGHRRLVIIGTVIFTSASAACGFTPQGEYAEAWIIAFRAVQGVGAALLFAAALALVVATFPLNQRGAKLAIFFAVTGAMTGIGPLAGGYLTEWTWRAVFWVNIPIAIIALILTVYVRPVDPTRRVPIDWWGAVLAALGMGLSVFGFQHASTWGWSDLRTIAAIAAGLTLLLVFGLFELRRRVPLVDLRIFKIRAFLVENMVLFFASMVFVPLFFFGSLYSQISLGDSSANAGVYILTFFIGFFPASIRGGKVFDKLGAKYVVTSGAIISAVGFWLWSNQLTELSWNDQWWAIIIAGAGMGLIIGPASTDAINRAARLSYGEATGILQTARYYGSAMGLAILGTILIGQTATGASYYQDAKTAAGRIAFAEASQKVFTTMAIFMVVVFVISFIGLRPGVQKAPAEAAPAEQ